MMANDKVLDMEQPLSDVVRMLVTYPTSERVKQVEDAIKAMEKKLADGEVVLRKWQDAYSYRYKAYEAAMEEAKQLRRMLYAPELVPRAVEPLHVEEEEDLGPRTADGECRVCNKCGCCEHDSCGQCFMCIGVSESEL